MRWRCRKKETYPCLCAILMAISLYYPCGPSPASNDAARWYSPCLGKLLVLYNNNTYDHSIKIDALGETQWDTVSGSTITNCATGSDYVQPWNLSGFPKIFGCSIDIWRAWRDGLWTSSLAITAKCNGRRPASATETNCTVGIELTSSLGLLSYSTSLAKSLAAYSSSCATDPTCQFDITAYDDGTFAIA